MKTEATHNSTSHHNELDSVYAPIKADLLRFHQTYQERLRINDDFLQSINDYSSDISGKLLRPAMTLITANLTGGVNQNSIDLAIAVELLHSATLIHDDIVDNSQTRRNKPTINAKWGNNVSTIYGDYIYAHAFAALSNISDLTVHKWFAKCALNICVGEMKQVESRNLTRTPNVEEYLRMIENKTAALFEIACAIGAYSNKSTPDVLRTIRSFGKSFGMLYQIVDDCLDLVGQNEVLGKQNGTDFEQRDYTLPMIIAASDLSTNCNATAHEILIKMLNEKDIESSLNLIRETNAIQQSISIAESFAQKAQTELRSIKFPCDTQPLESLLKFMLSRIRSISL